MGRHMVVLAFSRMGVSLGHMDIIRYIKQRWNNSS